MLQKNSISAVIPTYNRKHSLQHAIDSVLSQEHAVCELIIVDDGSTDGSSQWINERYPDVILIQQSNQGVSSARNRAIERANGDWIAFLDSDDRWYPDKLVKQIQAINRNPEMRLCHCDEHWIRNGKRVNPKNKHKKYGGQIFNRCLPLCAISPSATLIHQNVFKEVGMFDESLPACEDYDLWLRITAREPVLLVDEALLEKTGGHNDQLSRKYAAMDRFRIKALAKLIRNEKLSPEQQQATFAMLHEKLTIYINGARKRMREDVVRDTYLEYQDLLPADFTN